MKRYAASVFVALALMAMYAVVMAAPEAIPKYDTMSLALPVYDQPPAFSVAEERCVERMVFGEARNQSFAAQVAVAASAVNRSLTANFASHDLCKIVGAAGQYKGYSGGVALGNDIEIAAWDNAVAATQYALYNYGALPADYRRTLYFHTAGAKVNWRTSHKTLGRLDGLIFYGENSA